MYYRWLFGLAILFFCQAVLAQSPALVLPTGHTRDVVDATYSPDGKKIITASWDGTIKYWDSRTGFLLKDIKAHSQFIQDLTLAPNGKYIATASSDNLVRVWNLVNGDRAVNYAEHQTAVSSVLFSPAGDYMASLSSKQVSIWKIQSKQVLTVSGPFTSNCHLAVNSNGTMLAVATSNNSILLIDAASGKTVQELTGHLNEIRSIWFSADDKIMISASDDRTAIIWDAVNGKNLQQLKGHADRIWYALFNQAGNMAYTCGTDGELYAWDLATGQQKFKFEGHENGIPYAELDETGRYLLTASLDQTARCWDLQSGTLLQTYSGHDGAVFRAHFGKDNKTILTASGDHTAKEWDFATGRIIHDLSGLASGLRAAVYHPDGTFIATSSDDHGVRIWDNNSGKLLHTLKGHTGYVNYISFSPSGRLLLSASNDSTVRVWEMATGKLLRTINHHQDLVYMADFSQDEKRIVSASADEKMIITEMATGNKLAEKEMGGLVLQSRFSKNDQYLLTMIHPGKARLFDGTASRLLLQVEDAQNTNMTAVISPDSKYLFTSSGSGLKSWDIKTGKMVREMVDESVLPGAKAIHLIVPAADNSIVATASQDSMIRIWDIRSGKVLHQFREHHYGISGMYITPDNKKLVSASILDNRILVWDLISGKLIQSIGTAFNEHLTGLDASRKWVLSFGNFQLNQYQLLTGKKLLTTAALGDKDFININQAGYYYTTPDAAKQLHYVTADLRVIAFEQLDLKYNRPDKVLQTMGNTDTALISSFRKAWEKRIKRLGIDTISFRDGYSVPVSDFLNRDMITYEQKSGTLELHIAATDSSFLLDRFNVWVNEAPVFGQRGISIRKNKSQQLDTIITVTLSQGENRIECSVTNVNGTESYRLPLFVRFTPAVKQKEAIKFIGIGMDRFNEKGHDLQYSVKDIRDLASRLKEKYGNSISIDTLFNEQVSSKRVSSLKQVLQQTTVNDKVIIAYSGHGLLSKNYDYYLSTWNINFNTPEQEGLSYEELENLLDSIPARRKLMLIDACHSGEVDKEEMTRITNAKDTLSQQGTKGGKPSYTGKTTLGMKNSFELMQSLFVNVGKSTGATVISAAAGTQFALERGDLKNGVFTYSILEAMNKYPAIRISELRKIVGERVEKLTNGLQKPTSRNETIASDWTL